MKRFLSLFLALVFVISMLVACDNPDKSDDKKDQAATTTEATTEETTTSSTTEAPVAENKIFTNGVFSFAYPGTWEKSEADGIVILSDTNGNNINIVSIPKTDEYENTGTNPLSLMYSEQYMQQGLSIDNFKREDKETNGVFLVEISFIVQATGNSDLRNRFKQTQFVFTVEELTYIITVTEIVSNPEMRKNVFETLTLIPV